MKKTIAEKKEKTLNKIIEKIHGTNLPNRQKQDFMFFCISFPMSEKHTKTFLKLDNKAGVIAYLHKHLIRTAIKNNVPKVYISQYYEIKKRINHRWYKNERDKNIRKMEESAQNIFKATQQMHKFLNSRKMKIQKLQENIQINDLENNN